jgi:hypothetical protein
MMGKVQRSTVGGVQVTSEVPWSEDARQVPSYVVIAGSVNDAAKSLGFRVLGRRERPNASTVVAELHERGVSGSFWCVQA